jgi:hypothetical protein
MIADGTLAVLIKAAGDQTAPIGQRTKAGIDVIKAGSTNSIEIMRQFRISATLRCALMAVAKQQVAHGRQMPNDSALIKSVSRAGTTRAHLCQTRSGRTHRCGEFCPRADRIRLGRHVSKPSNISAGPTDPKVVAGDLGFHERAQLASQCPLSAQERRLRVDRTLPRLRRLRQRRQQCDLVSCFRTRHRCRAF